MLPNDQDQDKGVLYVANTATVSSYWECICSRDLRVPEAKVLQDFSFVKTDVRTGGDHRIQELLHRPGKLLPRGKLQHLKMGGKSHHNLAGASASLLSSQPAQTNRDLGLIIVCERHRDAVCIKTMLEHPDPAFIFQLVLGREEGSF